MTISKDAVLSTLLFLLPGFIAVGCFVHPFKWLKAPDLSRSTFVILSLSLSVPLNLVFAWTVRFAPPWLTSITAVPTLDSGTLSQRELLGLSLLYVFSAALGLLFAWIISVVRQRRWAKAGTCIEPGRDSVWHTVLKSRSRIPWVIATTEKTGYYGKLRHFTTSEEDPHIYLTQVQLVPLHSVSGFPLMEHAQEPASDGVLLRVESLTSLWFITK